MRKFLVIMLLATPFVCMPQFITGTIVDTQGEKYHSPMPSYANHRTTDSTMIAVCTSSENNEFTSATNTIKPVKNRYKFYLYI